MKKYMIWIDSLINTFSIIEAGKDIEYNYQDKDNNAIFNGLEVGDIVLGYYSTPVEKISSIFVVKDLKNANTIVLNKSLETANGPIIEDDVFIVKLQEKGIIEISDQQYEEIMSNMIPGDRREEEPILGTRLQARDQAKIGQEDFREWLSQQIKKDGQPLSDEYKNAYFYILRSIPSMLGAKDVFSIKDVENFDLYRADLEARNEYEEANPIGSGTLSAALTQYRKYLAERTFINIPKERLAQILKQWYVDKCVEGNVTSTLVGFGFKYAKAIDIAKVSAKALLEWANIETTMMAYIDRGKDLYFAIEKNSIGVTFEVIKEEPEEKFDFNDIKGNAINKIFFGMPGCGKSYHIEHAILGKDKDAKEYIGAYSKERIIRTTFYQDYSNTDFVGQILPKVVKGENGEDIVEYIFNPGPFTLALIQAISNPTKKVALIIEEINRGNAPAIFGDIFQLLDRDPNGISEYGIVNVSMMDYLNAYEFVVDGKKKHYTFSEIKIPGNMDIFATMNTSDQNVYTLDTAFVRRWERVRIRNSFDNCKFRSMPIPGMIQYTWEEFVTSINIWIARHLEELQVNEDKQLGAFFVKESLLSDNDAETFAYKVFDYLWSDVAKLDRGIFFNSYDTLESLIDAYKTNGVGVFKTGIFTAKTTVKVEEEENNE